MNRESTATRQYLATICVNIVAVSCGAFCAWPSASFLVLQSPESPLESGPMTNDDAGWVIGIFSIGGTLGTILGINLAKKIGRKKSILLTALPITIAWVLIPFAETIFHLLLSRLFGGLCSGGVCGIIPLYITEIAEDRIRGKLGTFLVLAFNFGVFCSFILGNFYTYTQVAWTFLTLSFLFIICFSLLPETPQYLLKIHKYDEAEKALCYFRNISSSSKEQIVLLQQELEKMKPSVKTEESNQKLNWQDFNNHQARRAFLVAFVLMLLNQACGCFAMINYTATIFQQSGSNLSPNVSAIIVGGIQLLGCYMSTLLVERAGRKFLLILSSFGIGIGQFALGTYIYLNTQGYDVVAFSWIPIASFSFLIFIACWGLLSLPFVIVSEIMPPKIREIGCMIGNLLLWTSSFFALKFLPLLCECIGLHGAVFVFGTSCFIGAIIIMIILPETKGKDIETILSML